MSTDKRIAEGKLGELVGQRNAQRHGHAPKNISWREFVDQYIAKSKLEKKKPTWQGEARAFRNFEAVCPIFRLSQMTPLVLEKCKNHWIKISRGPYVINRDLRAIRTAMHKAEAWGYIPRQDWRSVSYISVPKGRLRYYSDDELKRLERVCHGPYKTVLYLGAQAGLRRAEIANLEWSDVDFGRNRIHIEPKKDWIPKDNDRRWIPMSPDLKRFLSSLSARKRGRYVVGNSDNKMNVESLSVYFRRLVFKAGIGDGSIHTLRHTFASRLVTAGVSLYAVSKMLGHSKTETTEIYSHLGPESLSRDIEKLPAIL